MYIYSDMVQRTTQMCASQICLHHKQNTTSEESSTTAVNNTREILLLLGYVTVLNGS